MDKLNYVCKSCRMIEGGINNSAYATTNDITLEGVKFFEYFLIETLKIINTMKKLATFSTRPSRFYGTAKMHKSQYLQDIPRDNITFRIIIYQASMYT